MTISDRFSSAMGRRDEEPNKLLAREIITTLNTDAVCHIIDVIRSQPHPDTLADALKVLEMIGQERPELAHPAFPALIPLIGHPENKIVWRTMAALSTIASFHLPECYGKLDLLLNTMERGSVITRDHGLRILLLLYQDHRYHEQLRPLLTEQVLTSPDNQLGQYAERWMAVIDPRDVPDLIRVLEGRLPDLVSPSHQKRISRVLLKLNQTK